MLNKPHESFISLTPPEHKKTAMPEPMEMKPHGPSLYVHDVPLPLSDDDVGKVRTATVKVKLTRISKETSDGKTKKTFDLEVTAIKFS